MKRLFLLLAVACVGFASCSENLNGDDPNEIPSQLEELKKRFDFSEVNTEGLKIKKVYEATNDENIGDNPYDIAYRNVVFEYTHSDLAVAVGEINDCLWLGLFDRESGKLKYQYTDLEHPTSYSYYQYGIKYEYEYNGVGEIYGIYFEDDDIVLAIQYFIKEFDKARLDLIAFDENGKICRTAIFENGDHTRSCYGFKLYDNLGFSIRKWSKNTIYLYSSIEHSNLVYYVVYDFLEKNLLCNVDVYAHLSPFYIYLRSRPNISSILNPLHFWYLDYSDEVRIYEYKCTYNTITATEEYVKVFEPYTGDSSKAPRYSYEYKTKTDEYISVVVTQTEYDGTITQKTVDIRLIDDELKVEIQ